jgi:hypothetical protein
VNQVLIGYVWLIANETVVSAIHNGRINDTEAECHLQAKVLYSDMEYEVVKVTADSVAQVLSRGEDRRRPVPGTNCKRVWLKAI